MFFYTVPDTDITIVFQDWGHETRPITEARLTLRDASRECLGHKGTTIMPVGKIEWYWGSTVLEVTPETQWTKYNKPLTWGSLLRAIAGFQGWLRAYPGVYFGFELFELVQTEEREMVYAIGSGQLTVYI